MIVVDSYQLFVVLLILVGLGFAAGWHVGRKW